MPLWTTGDVITATKLNQDGTDLVTHAALTVHMPSGAILMWHGLIAAIPTGYTLCDGTAGTPDLRSKFLRGAPPATEAGGTGGADTHTLSEAEMPIHTHLVPGGSSGGGGAPYTGGGSDNLATSSTGSGNAHNNMPAYYQILFIMKT